MIAFDIPEAVQAAAAVLPEEQAWSMIYAEWGVLGLLAATVITVLWRLLGRFIEETRTQNAGLVSAQASAIKMLSEAVGRVEHAVQLSDVHNTHALKALTDNLGAVVVRLDRHEARLERHSDRINVMEVERKIDERTAASKRNGVEGRQ